MQFLLTIVQSVYLFVITRVWNQNLAVTNVSEQKFLTTQTVDFILNS